MKPSEGNANGACSTYANDAVGANQLDEAVRDGALGVALAVSLNVAEIANVTGLIGGSTVGLAVGVDWEREHVLSANHARPSRKWLQSRSSLQ